MGLDMYLNANKYVYSDNLELSESLKQLIPEMADYKLEYITWQVLYWRKANAIHKWFVDNVQDGKDDCAKYNVTMDDLHKLYDIVCKLLTIIEMPFYSMTYFKEQCHELLPCTDGFFFGGEEYDDYYIICLKKTRDGLNKIFEISKTAMFEFDYQSSW